MNETITLKTVAQIEEQVARELAARQLGGQKQGAFVILSVAEVETYEGNPRVQSYPAFDDFVAGIRIRGLESDLAVTRRPGAKKYTLARGGNTRLKALQILAKEDPRKWAKHRFTEVPYVSELHMLTSHLIENTDRKNMCFWDSAVGVMNLKRQLEKEHSNSARDFERTLVSKGINIKKDVLLGMQFAVENLEALGEWKQYLGLRQIKENFRPTFIALQHLWSLHPGALPGALKTQLDETMTAHVHAAVTSGQPYNIDQLIATLTEAVATRLGYTYDRFAQAAAIQTGGTTLTLAELKNIAASNQNDDDSDAYGHQRSNSNAEFGGIGTNASFNSLTPVSMALNPSDNLVRGTDNSNAQLQATQQSINQVQQFAGLDEQPDVKVVKGLVQCVPEGNDQQKFNADKQQVLDMDHDAPAWRYAGECLVAIARIGGIDHLLTNTHGLPLKFYMELPKQGELGSDHSSLGMQTWWLLAALSGQLDHEILNAFLDAHKHATEDVRPIFLDTGMGCFQHAISSTDTWIDALQTRLGGDEANLYIITRNVLANQKHPLHRAAMELFSACAYCNTLEKK